MGTEACRGGGGVSSWSSVGGRQLAHGRPGKAGFRLRRLGTIGFMSPDARGELQLLWSKSAGTRPPFSLF